MSSIQLLGATLRKPDGSTISTSDALNGKEVLGLYFSAHWCPPCRGFTPELGKRYQSLLAAGKSLEIVFVSSDKDAKAFDEYHHSMPFLALPFADRDAKNKLSKKFHVEGIPTLVFVDIATGETITTEGRESISDDNYLDAFPYRPRKVDVVQSLGDVLLKPDGSQLNTAAALNGKQVLGLYFSAHWCPPCRGFTPVLSKRYTALQEAGKSVELVYISSDRKQDDFNGYHREMTFPALPFAQREAARDLGKHFGIEGIPSLVFVDLATKEIITKNGRGAIAADSFLEDFPYAPKPVNDLGTDLEGINEEVSLVVFMEGVAPAVQNGLTDLLLQVAKGELAKREDDRIASKFFTGKGDGPVDKIRNACFVNTPAGLPSMILLDLADEGAFYHPAAGQESVDAANIAAFLRAFKAGALPRGTFGRSAPKL